MQSGLHHLHSEVKQTGGDLFREMCPTIFVDKNSFFILLFFSGRRILSDWWELWPCLLIVLKNEKQKKQRKQRLSAGCECSCWHPVNEFIIFIVLYKNNSLGIKAIFS
jgi:hypothetical protein